ANPGAMAVQSAYYDMVVNLWNDAPALGFDTFAQNIVYRFTPNPDKDPNAPMPNAAFINAAENWMDAQVQAAAAAGRAAEAADPQWAYTTQVLGWAGAGIWYNKLSELNGSYIASVFNLPEADQYPDVMEYVKEQRKRHNADDSGVERYKPVLGDNARIFYRKPAEDNIAL